MSTEPIQSNDDKNRTCAILDRIIIIESAFPDGAANHREAHIAWMEAKQAEKEFWQELKLDIAKKGVWGILIICLGLIFLGISVKLGITK